MARLQVRTKDNPKLQQNVLKDGRISLYLEYYLGRTQEKDETTGKIKVKHDRRKEALQLYLLSKPKTPEERQKNKETLELAYRIRAEKEQERKNEVYGYRIGKDRKINFLQYYNDYIESYNKKDIRMVEGSLSRFKDFLKVKYPDYIEHIRPGQLTRGMVIEFSEYLKQRSRGEGARSYFQRFKKVIKSAIEKELLPINPCRDVIIKSDNQNLVKDILSQEEIQKLISTHYQYENPEIRKAFIFSLYTGIRFCDVDNLKFSNVDYSNKVLSFSQAKTDKNTITPLNDGLLKLIGSVPLSLEGEPLSESLIFKLPSHTMCLKALKRWTKRAGITKHITWHCARHSFATNILINGANIATVGSLLGHRGLKHTEKYTRAVDDLKKAAIDSLPELKISQDGF